jgi:lipid-binding SYLF domain-containing protein
MRRLGRKLRVAWKLLEKQAYPIVVRGLHQHLGALKKRRSIVRIFLALLLTAGFAFADHKGATRRLDESVNVFSEIMAAPDKGIPDELLEKAQCIVIVPGLKKGAFIVGAEAGKGFMSCRSSAGHWSAPGAVRVEGGSVGFQIGGSETDVVMLVMNRHGEDRLLSSKFTLGADAEVAAGPVGRTAEAQTDAKMTAEILTWSRSRGVFAGLALKGATLREDDSANEELYGKRMENKQIVESGIAPPAEAERFVSMLNKYSSHRSAQR